MFCKIGVLKIFANFARKHPCWSRFVVKPPEVKRLQDRCFPMNFAKLLRTAFFTEHLQWSWSLSLKKFYVVGVHKKVFECLVANEFPSNSKNYLRFSCISIFCFSIFSIACFFQLMKLLSTSA